MNSSTKNIGDFGEKLARDFLLTRGYNIQGQNVRLGHKEIDLIAKTDQTTVFVEIKTNTSPQGEPELALTPKQTRTLKKAISGYCYENKINKNLIRMDLITITLNKQKQRAHIKHYQDII